MYRIEILIQTQIDLFLVYDVWRLTINNDSYFVNYR